MATDNTEATRWIATLASITTSRPVARLVPRCARERGRETDLHGLMFTTRESCSIGLFSGITLAYDESLDYGQHASAEDSEACEYCKIMNQNLIQQLGGVGMPMHGEPFQMIGSCGLDWAQLGCNTQSGWAALSWV